MKVYKFGGASVRNAQGVRNMREILSGQDGQLFVVVSAMGKTTNALEVVTDHYCKGEHKAALDQCDAIEQFHREISEGLFGVGSRLPEPVVALIDELRTLVNEDDYRRLGYDRWYDEIVSYGEMLSSTLIACWFNANGPATRLVDMRRVLMTDGRSRCATVDLEASTGPLRSVVATCGVQVLLGQGFIGGMGDGRTVTLGREGSDYSAAVVANILDASELTIWKDVEGVMNGDPKFFPDARYIPEMTYQDAIELAYSGAQIIHPKTIKPLQNKNIPLYVRPFTDPGKPGTVIKSQISHPVDIPVRILKRDQILITIKAEDFSFVLEDRLTMIFSILERFAIKINLIQSSAISLSLCIDATRDLERLMSELHIDGFKVWYNDGLELLTVRGYTSTAGLGSPDDDTLLVQRTRRIARTVRRQTATEKD